MKPTAKYTLKHRISSVLMIVTMLWLTISLPFTYNAQQQLTKYSISHLLTDDTPADSEDANPFSNNTEEKAGGTSNAFSEEYLHDHNEHFLISDKKLNHTHSHSYDVYVAFHGELLSPPPEFILS